MQRGFEELQSTVGNQAVATLVQRDADNSYHRIAGDITSQFESGGDYGKLQTYDMGVVSYGKHQATLTGGNLEKVVEDYTKRSAGATAKTLATYLPRLKSKDKSLAEDKGFIGALKEASADKAMHAAQDAVFKKQYWDPAAKRAKKLGVTSALGHALLYDMTIQGAVGYRVEEAIAKLGGKVGDVVQGKKITEQDFLKAVVEARIAAGKRQSERNINEGKALLVKAAAETDAKKKAALTREGNRKIANGKAMLTSATKTRGPTWMALVESGDLNMKGDAKGQVTLVGKGNKKIRGLKDGATIDGTAAGASVPGTPLTKQQATQLPIPKSDPPDDIATLVAASLPPAMKSGGGLAALLGTAGAALAPSIVVGLAAAGYADVNKLTNVAFWLRHPDLTGTKLSPGQPNFAALSKEWLEVREGVVKPALAAGTAKPKQSAAAAASPTPAAPVPKPKPAAPAAAVTPKPAAPAAAAAAQTAAVQAPAGDDAFIKNWVASSIDKLPPAQRNRFKSIEWGWMDFPGTTKWQKGMTPEEIEAWRKDKSLVETKIKGKPAFVGKHQDEAQELLDLLGRGRERRVNRGDHAVLKEEEFNLAPQAFDDFVTKQIKEVPGQGGARLHHEAGQAFAEMRAAAKKAGIPLIILSGYRPRSSEKAAAARAGNLKAVGAFSPHSLGLAADLKLHIGAGDLAFVETSTGDFRKMLNMMKSPVYKWMYEHAADFGFYQYRNEPWHWEYNPKGFKDRFFASSDELQKKLGRTAKT